jgi:8-oxo-dGTP pyrophosphatase MutT (NUDIX family)
MNRYDPNYVLKPIYFQVGVKVVVFGPGDRILLLKRSAQSSHPGSWDLPGGGVDRGENPLKSAIREVKEESGLLIMSPSITTTYLQQDAVDEAIIIGYSAVAYTADVSLSWEHSEHRWVTEAESKEMDIPELHRAMIDAAVLAVDAVDND